MVPAALWRKNLRHYLTRTAWNKLRMTHNQFEKQPNCEPCGSTPIGHARQAHEEWSYDIQTATSRLAGVRTICQMCHFVEHFGFVNVMVAKGQFTPDIFKEIERHFCRVNRCKPIDFRRHRREAQRRYVELERVAAWSVDFGPYAHLVPLAADRIVTVAKTPTSPVPVETPCARRKRALVATRGRSRRRDARSAD